MDLTNMSIEEAQNLTAKMMADQVSARYPESIKLTKAIRLDLMKCLNTIQAHFPPQGFFADAIRQIYLCRFWLGKALRAFGEESPYKEGNDPNSNEVNKMSDVTNEYYDITGSPIKKVKQIRLLLAPLDRQIRAIGNAAAHPEAEFYCNKAAGYAEESRYFLGMVLPLMAEAFVEKPTSGLVGLDGRRLDNEGIAIPFDKIDTDSLTTKEQGNTTPEVDGTVEG